MRARYIVVAVTLLVGVVLAAGSSAEDIKWWDMEKCAMCKPLAAKPGLMESVNWEGIKVSNGIVMIGTTTPEKLGDFRDACTEMNKVQERLAKGEKVEMCGFCLEMGALMMAGAKHESVLTSTGNLSLITSSDAKVQKQIWAFQDKTDEMMKIMMAEQPQEKPKKE